MGKIAADALIWWLGIGTGTGMALADLLLGFGRCAPRQERLKHEYS